MHVICSYNYAYGLIRCYNSDLTDRYFGNGILQYLRSEQEISYGIRAARARLAVS